MGVMAVMKGTPTTYNKDFQECWEMMYDTVDTIYDCIRIATGVLSTIKTRPDRMLKGRSAAGTSSRGSSSQQDAQLLHINPALSALIVTK